ncbi:WD40 repeat-like protein, partial [Thelephora ganbajun]
MSGIITANPGGDSIRSVAVDLHSKRIAVTSDDKAVKVIDLKDTKGIVLLEGHSRGVRRAAWHPSGILLATCGCDGKIIIWDVLGTEPKLEKILEGIIPTVINTEAPEYCHDCSVSWHPSGQ